VEAEKLNPPSIFVAARSRGDDAPIWATVGKLTKQNSYYEFRYTMGARKLPDVAPFPGLPDLEKVYQMEDIFPIFKNRLLSERRPEYKKWLSWGGFDPDVKPDAISVLSTLGSRRAADSLFFYTVYDTMLPVKFWSAYTKAPSLFCGEKTVIHMINSLLQ